MRKLRTYWYSLKASLSEPEYYFSLRSTRIFFSVQFFFFSLFLIALFEVPNWSYRLIPAVAADVRSEVTSAMAQLPEDAVFTYTGDKLETHGLSLPKTITSTQRAQDLGYPKNLVEIKGEDTPSSAAWTLTPNRVLFALDESPAREAKYSDLFGEDTGSLSRDQIRTGLFSFLDTVGRNTTQIAIVLASLGFFASIVSGIFTILMYSIMVQVIGWILGVRITYKFALRWGLHIFPIALAIQEISSLLSSTNSFPILAVSYIAIATLILWVGRSERPTIVFK